MKAVVLQCVVTGEEENEEEESDLLHAVALSNIYAGYRHAKARQRLSTRA